MTEERHRLLDIIFKAVTAIVTLIGLWVGYTQFLAEFERSNRRPFVEMQTKYYIEMLETVARISHPKDEDDRIEATRRFWQLFVGTSALVEDKLVEEKTTAISVCMKKPSACPASELEAHALSLSAAVKSSLGRSWGSTEAGP